MKWKLKSERRSETVFHDRLYHARAHYDAAVAAMGGAAGSRDCRAAGVSFGDIERSWSGERAVTFGRSMNGKFFVRLENFDAR